jgi:hypothetical protein
VLREKFGFNEVELQKADGFMRRCARGVEPAERLEVVKAGQR